MGFRTGNLDFEKISGGVKVIITNSIGKETSGFIPDDSWVSVITEMSHKPENADQYKKAEEFHLGEK